MLKYIIPLCILSFCDSDPSISGDFRQLVLVQQSPITSFFTPTRYVNTSASEFLTYLREHWIVFSPRSWILRGLWPTNATGHNLTECVSSNGSKLTYNHENLDENFIDELKARWPVLKMNETEEILWETEYNKHGSCVSVDDAFYFSVAIQLLHRYNVGNVLAISSIVPGKSYASGHILASLKETLGKEVSVKCLSDKNLQKQYLLEVQICFNTAYNLANCYSPGIQVCDTHSTIIYPGNSIN